MKLKRQEKAESKRQSKKSLASEPPKDFSRNSFKCQMNSGNPVNLAELDKMDLDWLDVQTMYDDLLKFYKREQKGLSDFKMPVDERKPILHEKVLKDLSEKVSPQYGSISTADFGGEEVKAKTFGEGGYGLGVTNLPFYQSAEDARLADGTLTPDQANDLRMLQGLPLKWNRFVVKKKGLAWKLAQESFIYPEGDRYLSYYKGGKDLVIGPKEIEVIVHGIETADSCIKVYNLLEIYTMLLA